MSDVRTTTPPSVLTIAGSDSGGGAGIQADLKTFLTLGVHGASAVTAITSQNTVGVREVFVLPSSTVRSQVEAVVSDIEISATKTGMLANREIIETVADLAASGSLPNLVVDPVMVAASGDRLLDPDAEDAYCKTLFPHALVVTPNLREASVLVQRSISSIADMEQAADAIAAFGPRYVVVKGGHLEDDEAIDVMRLPDGSHKLLRARRIETRNIHGTGCTFASAIAAFLAKGEEPVRAIEAAKEYITHAIASAAAWKIGSGRGPVDHFWRARQNQGSL
jgi:hydroxymethylpyrimidine/phosphomethylpyrimidine kinase